MGPSSQKGAGLGEINRTSGLQNGNILGLIRAPGDWRCFRQRDVMKSRGMVSKFVKSQRIEGFPCWLSGKRTCLPSRKTLVQEDPWRRKWQHIAVFFPWEVEVEKSLSRTCSTDYWNS